MIIELILTMYLAFKPGEKASPVVSADQKTGYLSLDKYQDLALTPQPRHQPVLIASSKIVAPGSARQEIRQDGINLSQAMPQTNSMEYLEPLFEKYGNL